MNTSVKAPEDSAKTGKMRKKLRTAMAYAAMCLGAAVLITACTPAGARFWSDLCYLSGMEDRREEQSLLELHFLDVGKADAVLIKSEGRAALLDAGNYATAFRMDDYLSRYGVEELDYLIMSHPDKDHIGGMNKVLEEIKVNVFVQGELPLELEPDSQEYRNLQLALDRQGIERVVLPQGSSIKLGGAKLSVLGPLREYDSANDASLVLRLTCGEFSALFCGDMEEKPEKDLVESGQQLHADLIKVGHHGSKTSTSQEFLEAVDPDIAVICVGPDRNQLPRQQVLMRLEAAGAQVFRTDLDGDIQFIYDGEELRLRPERKG